MTSNNESATWKEPVKAGGSSGAAPESKAAPEAPKAPVASIEEQLEAALKTNDGIDKEELIALSKRYEAEKKETILESKEKLAVLLREAFASMLKNGFTLKNPADVDFLLNNKPDSVVLSKEANETVSAIRTKGETATVRLDSDGKTLVVSGVFGKLWNLHHENLHEMTGDKPLRYKADAIAAKYAAMPEDERAKMKVRLLELANRVSMAPSVEGPSENARRTEEAYVADIVFEIENGRKGNAKETMNVRMKTDKDAQEVAKFLRDLANGAIEAKKETPAVAKVPDEKAKEGQAPADVPAEKANYEASKRFLANNPGARKHLEEFLARNPDLKDAFENLVKNPRIQDVTALQLAIGIPSGKPDAKFGRADGIYGNKTDKRLEAFLKGKESVREVSQEYVRGAIAKTRSIRAERAAETKRRQESTVESPVESIAANWAKHRNVDLNGGPFEITLAKGNRVVSGAKFAKDYAADMPDSSERTDENGNKSLGNGYVRFVDSDGKEHDFHVHEITRIVSSGAEKTKTQELWGLQENVLKYLEPRKKGQYLVKTEFLKDGFTSPVTFAFDGKEWTYTAFGSPNHSVRKLESSMTADGGIKLNGSFQFSEPVQKAVVAAIMAMKKADEYGLPLPQPGSVSPLAASIPK